MDTIDYDLSSSGDFEKLFDMSLHKGTITDVDYENNKADVVVADLEGTPYSDVEIFYHCEDDSTDNGASAFVIDDKVWVINEKGKCNPDSSDLKIVGFQETKKNCKVWFIFKLTRGDGTEITEDSGLLSNIEVYNSSKVLISTTLEWKFDISRWKVTINNLEDVDLNGYFVTYGCLQRVWGSVQYPYRYLDADKWQSSDLIQPGSYEDTIPYKYVEDLVIGPNYFSPIDWGNNCPPASGDISYYPDFLPLDIFGYVDTLTFRQNVISSIPFKAVFDIWVASADRGEHCADFIASPCSMFCFLDASYKIESMLGTYSWNGTGAHVIPETGEDLFNANLGGQIVGLTISNTNSAACTFWNWFPNPTPPPAYTWQLKTCPYAYTWINLNSDWFWTLEPR